MDRLVYCPVCANKGFKNILGRIVKDGFEIKRFHKGITKICGTNFVVVCGSCKEPIYFKKKPKVRYREIKIKTNHATSRVYS